MVLIKIESLSQKELEHIAIQEGVQDAASLSREELIETLREIYEEESEDASPSVEENIQRRFVTWLTDYRGEASEVTSLPGVEALPDLYSETSIHIMTKNATWLYCYWSLAPLDDQKLVEDYGSYSLYLQVILTENGRQVDSYDIAVSSEDVEWNININAKRGEAQVNLVAQAGDGRRVVLAHSSVVQLVSCWWLEHSDEIAANENLLRRQLGLITNREGALMDCETVYSIVAQIEKEGLNG